MTTITVRRYVKESLDKHRDGRPWGQFLEMLRREHADPITFNDVERMAEVLAEEIDGGGDMDSDDLAHDVAEQFDYAMLADQVAERVVDALEGRR